MAEFKNETLLSELLTKKNPLGPIRHERIMKRAAREQDGVGRNDWLLYKTDLFDRLIKSDSSLIVGRRGSGKTAVVAALKTAAGRSNDYYFKRERASNTSKDIFVFINSWEHLDTLVDRVGRAVVSAPGWDGDWNAVLVERIARLWRQEFWQEILKQIYDDCIEDKEKSRCFKLVTEYIRGDDFSPYDDISIQQVAKKIQTCKNEVLAYLQQNDSRCLILIDSLEQYPVTSPKISRVLGGFLKTLNDFPDEHPRINVKCCIPEEIYPILIDNASNILKDLADGAEKLVWTPIELLKIVAERYREFLRIHDPGEFSNDVEKLDFETREGIIKFFNQILPPTISNRCGAEESSIAYIIRHTQLLPREFILIFNSAIKKAKRRTRSWSFIDQDSLIEAICEEEPFVSEQILNPYRAIYPDLLEACTINLPSLPRLFEMSHLDAVVARFPKATKELAPDIRSLLFGMGIIGYCDPLDNKKSGRYVYARFHFNSASPISFAEGRQYCLHPVFSGRWSVAQQGYEAPFVYPAGVPEVI